MSLDSKVESAGCFIVIALIVLSISVGSGLSSVAEALKSCNK